MKITDKRPPDVNNAKLDLLFNLDRLCDIKILQAYAMFYSIPDVFALIFHKT